MSFLLSGTSVLIGTPIGGAILGNGSDREWRDIIAYSGTTMLIAALLLAVSLFLHRRRAKKVDVS